MAEQIDHTHNGYLNIAVQVGSVGLVLAVIAAVLVPATGAFSAARFGRERAVLTALLFFIVLRDFLEDTIIDRSNPCWIVLVGVVSIVNRETVADVFRVMQARYRNFAVSATGDL